MSRRRRPQLLAVLIALLAGVALVVPSAASAADDPALDNTAVPTITGTGQVGLKLSVDTPGRWTPAPTSRSLQWLSDGQPIAGATKTFYRVVPDDVGHELSLQETASAPGYSDGVAISRAVTARLGEFELEGFGLSFDQEPIRVGTHIDGVEALVQPDPDTTTYTWLRDRAPITGAVSDHYRVVRADAGHALRVRLGFAREGYRDDSFTVRVKRIRAYDAEPPSVTGRARAGHRLVGDKGTWFGAGYHYHLRWTRDGKRIPGAHASTYGLTARDRGHRIALLVVARKPKFETVQKTSRSVRVG